MVLHIVALHLRVGAWQDREAIQLAADGPVLARLACDRPRGVGRDVDISLS